ncbi:MAG: hypothetical protein WBO73_10360 [Gammaproteobacteria bacterium]|jgi:hypothetical protein
MSRPFTRCKGKTMCNENETECRTCGRTLEEIYTTRRFTDELANFIVDMDYDNVNDFMYYLLNKVTTKVSYLGDQKHQALSNGYH